ncbi:MAG: hypothetical protein ACI83P_001848 [Janthinobacterium sp.]
MQDDCIKAMSGVRSASPVTHYPTCACPDVTPKLAHCRTNLAASLFTLTSTSALRPNGSGAALRAFAAPEARLTVCRSMHRQDYSFDI